MHIDAFKLIQSGGDGGDTCHREFTMHLRILLNFKLAIEHGIPLSQAVRDIGELITSKQLASAQETEKLLCHSKGLYVRHPDPTFWGSDPRNCSRDQLAPVICYLAFLSSRSGELGKEYRTKLKDLLIACLKRGMFAQNIYPNWVSARSPLAKKKVPDFINFDLWGIFARGWVNTWAFPIALPFVLLGDLFLVLSVLVHIYGPVTKDGTLEFYSPGPDSVDDDNINNCLMVAQHTYSTPLAYLARKVYKKYRKANFGNMQLGEKDPIMGALAWYHRAPEGNPELAEIARNIVNNY